MTAARKLTAEIRTKPEGCTLVQRRRKLIDIFPSTSDLCHTLERFLKRHSIAYERVEYDGFARYLVAPTDLCCAQSVLPALAAIAGGEA